MSAKTEQVGGSHYKDMAIQPFEYIYRNGIGFAEGCVIKYVSRWKTKNGVEDLKKARHFLDLLIEQEEDANEPAPSFREQSPGWRFLEAGETIEDRDEFNTVDGWVRTECEGNIVEDHNSQSYRRRIASEKGGK